MSIAVKFGDKIEVAAHVAEDASVTAKYYPPNHGPGSGFVYVLSDEPKELVGMYISVDQAKALWAGLSVALDEAGVGKDLPPDVTKKVEEASV